jgi:hypothetical protein
MNWLPPAATAVSVTGVPFAYESVQTAPQSIAPTVLVTVPDPPPAFTTVNVRAFALGVAAADTNSAPTRQSRQSTAGVASRKALETSRAAVATR